LALKYPILEPFCITVFGRKKTLRRRKKKLINDQEINFIAKQNFLVRIYFAFFGATNNFKHITYLKVG
jgi:hypothetical protein